MSKHWIIVGTLFFAMAAQAAPDKTTAPEIKAPKANNKGDKQTDAKADPAKKPKKQVKILPLKTEKALVQ